MSSLSWTEPNFQAHEPMALMSLLPPPVKMSSLALNPSVMNSELPALSVWALTRSQSSGSPAPVLSTALPSSSNRPLPTYARAAGARAKVKYCNSSDSTKSADHDRAKPRRVRAPMKCHSPRDAICLFLPIPEIETR